jgi:hypothetical protein
MDNAARIRDFAVLKIDKSGLKSLQLGNEDDVPDGSDVSIIGFPLSAIFRYPIRPIPRFCLFGTVTAHTSFPFGQLQYLDTVYFQGVSIKGISGAPVVSLDTEQVIGIVSTKLTGITPALDQQREALRNPGVVIAGHGFDSTDAFTGLIDTLDNQLANGLGSATGAADAKYGLDKAKREYERKHSKK